jgi:hypothetical protein
VQLHRCQREDTMGDGLKIGLVMLGAAMALIAIVKIVF